MNRVMWLSFGLVTAGLCSAGSVQAAPAAAAAPAPAAAPAAAPADSTEVAAAFKTGILAYDAGDYSAAAPLLERVAAESVVPERRIAARELARIARTRMGGGQVQPAAGGPALATTAGPVITKPETTEDRSRTTLLGSALILGLNYGWMVPVALDIDDDKLAVGTYLLTAGAAFAAPFMATRGEVVTQGMGVLGSVGGFTGLGHGALGFIALAGDDAFDGEAYRGMLGVMLATSLAESVGGYLWAERSQMSGGTASTVAAGSMWGAGYGAGAYLLLRGDTTDGPNARRFAGTLLLGSVAGALGGKYLGDRRTFTLGDASAMQTAGALGLTAGIVPLIMVESENMQVWAGGLMLSSAVGLWVGDRLVDGIDLTQSQAAWLSLGGVAGGALGLGLGYIASPDSLSGSNTAKLLTTTAVAGAIGGYALIYNSLNRLPETGSVVQNVSLAPLVTPNQDPGIAVVGTF